MINWTVSDYDWDASELAAAKKASPPGGKSPVEGCDSDLESLRPFYQRLRICEAHAKAHSVTDGSGRSLRFCQQCSRLQPVSAFEGDRRSCAASLDKRRARRSLGYSVVRTASPTSEDEEERPARRTRRAAAATQRSGASGTHSTSGNSSGEQSTLPAPLKSKLQAGSRGGARSPGSPEGGSHRRRGSNEVPADGNVPSAAAQMLAQWQPTANADASPMLSTVLFGSLADRDASAASGAAAPLLQGLPPIRLPAPASQAPGSPSVLLQLQRLDAAETLLQQQRACLLGGAGGGWDSGDLGGMPTAAGALAPPVHHPMAAAQLEEAEDELDLLLQMNPEELADALLGYHPSAADGMLAPQQPLAAREAPVAAPVPAMLGGSPLLPHAFAPGQSNSSASSAHEGSPFRVPLPAQQAGLHLPELPAAAAAAWPAELAQDSQLVTVCIKLFDTTPEHLPPDLRAQLQMALALTPTASMRPGCVCLTVTALLSAAELERLEGAHPSRLAAAVAAAVAQAASSATPSGRKLLVQAGNQLAAADSRAGTLTYCALPATAGSVAARLLAPPRLLTPAVLRGSDCSEPIQLALVGRGLADARSVLHCRTRGRHQVVAVLRVRRGGSAAAPAAAEEPHEPSTPPHADRPSRDNDGGGSGSGAQAPDAAGPAAVSPAAPSAAERAFEAAELAPGKDALLVQLAAPASGWGLFELEVASGALLSQAAPLLVLPSSATAAVAELGAGLEGMQSGDVAGLVRRLGFLMQAAEQAPPHEAAAAQRVGQLARTLALACGEHGWLATAHLLLPAMALGGEPSGSSAGSSSAAQSGKGEGRAPPRPGTAAAAALHASKGAAPEEQERLELLLARLAALDADEAAAAAAAEQHELHEPRGLRGLLAAHAADWFWTGCNLAAGAASLALLFRNSMREGGL